MSSWEQETMQKVLLEIIKEQRRARRWKVFFRLILLSLLLWAIIAANFGADFTTTKKAGPQIAVVDFKGIIDGDSKNYATVIEGVTNALNDKKTVAVLIRANSPGGSPVYSAMLYNELIRLRHLHPQIPVEMVVEEVCASGCYYAAAGAEHIYANPASIIGSIGVIYAGFGATEALKKLGIDSRLLISGRNKAMGYPFIPESQEQTVMQQAMLDEIHAQFIHAVQAGRGKRLQNDPDLFSGRYWIGEDARRLGLIDGYATVASLAREQFNSENIVDFSPEQDTMERLFKKIGVTLSDSARQAVLSGGLTGTWH